ncbi:DUF177 domain-containing protein [Brevibacterium sp. 50QC2O2]|jgi:uncharacterized protein|uniref:YceD family protein n=1 Tax=Brevibacterium TaxID=1696 RepID=UPI00211C1AA9|nr:MULTISPECIES: DUF177 domain-containing protein [unclassified Brevibacterium]MCQ9367794.1 DUF177 domain-containing protein [Brevibacterium sp. 91QC2O2]MCQ9384900.1 DUF177 domain-containing protein [Brevibacterium sp. 68QC2CO]MCQ9388053.1 DUF177 domain-containing protein [Brevibacterium sp. 50QC2O2]
MNKHSELELDLRSMNLLDKPGEWLKLEKTVAAPQDLRIEMIGIPAGDPMQLALQLESVVEGIYVTGTVKAVAKGQDARTLEELELDLDVPLNELFVYERDPEDEESYAVERGRIDLEPALRDAVVMSLPFRPLKTDDDGDFTFTTGVDFEPEGESDPRWSKLETLLSEEKES